MRPSRVIAAVRERGYQLPREIQLPLSRREVARLVWAELEHQPVPASFFQQDVSWQVGPTRDGAPGG